MAKDLKKENKELRLLLQDVVEQYDSTGCENCGVIPVTLFNNICVKLDPNDRICSRCHKLYDKSDINEDGECPDCVKTDERCKD